MIKSFCVEGYDEETFCFSSEIDQIGKQQDCILKIIQKYML